MPSPKSSSPYLKFLFNRFNRRYWGGRLPSETVVRWASKREWKGLIGTRTAPWGAFFYEDDGTPTILIDEEIQRRGWRPLRKGTLIHEMVHLFTKGRDNHGPVFEKEMLRLAKKGALKGVW